MNFNFIKRNLRLMPILAFCDLKKIFTFNFHSSEILFFLDIPTDTVKQIIHYTSKLRFLRNF